MIDKLKKKWRGLKKKLSYGFERTLFYEVLDTYSKVKNHVNVIHIGANDGVTGDPVYPYIKKKGWSGVLVEPIPTTFKLLKDNYKKFDSVQLLQAAVSNYDGEASIYCLDTKGTPFDRFNMTASFSRQYVEAWTKSYNIPDEYKKILEVKVPVKRVSTLKKEYGFEKVDLLLLDVEGFELDILEDINFQDLRPDILIFESMHIKKSLSERYYSFLSKLNKNEYIVLENSKDTISIHKSILPDLLKASAQIRRVYLAED